jgi:hypothetical protein
MISLCQPKGVLYGTFFGQKRLNFEGIAFAYDLKNALVSQVIFNPDRHGKSAFSFLGKSAKAPHDYFSGGVWRMER